MNTITLGTRGKEKHSTVQYDRTQTPLNFQRKETHLGIHLPITATFTLTTCCLPV